MDGAFYWDTREPFIGADIGSVNLSATFKALFPASNFPSLGGQYFARVGKKLRIRLFGKITTGATPGNGQIGVYWGTGADGNGTQLAVSKAFTLIANQTGSAFMMEIYVHCRAIGASGSLFVTGEADFAVAVVASTAQPVFVPEVNPAAVSVDLTQAYIISVQMLRSGSTAEAVVIHDIEVSACN